MTKSVKILGFVLWASLSLHPRSFAGSDGEGDRRDSTVSRRFFLRGAVGLGAAIGLGPRLSNLPSPPVAPAIAEDFSAWRAARMAELGDIPIFLRSELGAGHLRGQLVELLKKEDSLSVTDLSTYDQILDAVSEHTRRVQNRSESLLRNLEFQVVRFRVAELERLAPEALSLPVDTARILVRFLCLPYPDLDEKDRQELVEGLERSHTEALRHLVETRFPDLLWRISAGMAGEFKLLSPRYSPSSILVMGSASTGKSMFIEQMRRMVKAERFGELLKVEQIRHLRNVLEGPLKGSAKKIESALATENSPRKEEKKFRDLGKILQELNSELQFSPPVIRELHWLGVRPQTRIAKMMNFLGGDILAPHQFLELIRRIWRMDQRGEINEDFSLADIDSKFPSEALWPQHRLVIENLTPARVEEIINELESGRWPEDLRIEFTHLGLGTPSVQDLFGSETISIRGTEQLVGWDLDRPESRLKSIEPAPPIAETLNRQVDEQLSTAAPRPTLSRPFFITANQSPEAIGDSFASRFSLPRLSLFEPNVPDLIERFVEPMGECEKSIAAPGLQSESQSPEAHEISEERDFDQPNQ